MVLVDVGPLMSPIREFAGKAVCGFLQSKVGSTCFCCDLGIARHVVPEQLTALRRCSIGPHTRWKLCYTEPQVSRSFKLTCSLTLAGSATKSADMR